MKLSETNNVMPVEVTVGTSVEGNELRLTTKDSIDNDMEFQLALDQQTAAELLPILQHFIATGELPE